MKHKLFVAISLFIALVFLSILSWKKYNNSVCVRIPLKRDLFYTPMMDISIEGEKYSALFDSGSSYPFSLPKDILNKIKRKPYKNTSFSDYKRNSYLTPSYRVPKITVGPFVWRDIVVKQNHPRYEINTSFNPPENPQGSPVIGSAFLQKTNLLLDFYHAVIYACNDIKVLQKRGLISRSLIKIPFSVEGKLIFIKAQTDVGEMEFMVDTGATISIVPETFEIENEPKVLDKFPYVVSKNFSIQGHNFGPQKLYTIAPQRSAGILGMDFLRRFPIYIDYKNKCLYIGLKAEDRGFNFLY